MSALSVSLSVWNNSAPTGRIFVELFIGASIKTCRENLSLVKIGQKYQAPYVRA
jgi:hypothetical protein